MTDQSLFDKTSETKEPVETKPESQEAKQEQQPKEQQDQKPVLVYGDRVFSSEEEVIKKMVNADAFIEQLKDENKLLRDELEGLRQQVSELKGQIEMTQTQTVEPTQVTETPSAPVNPQDLAQLVNQVLEQKQQETMLQKNIREAEEAFISKYGDKAPEVLRQKASELGMTIEQLQQIAANSPQAFKKLTLGEGGEVPAQSLGTAVQGSRTNPVSVGATQPQENKTPLYKLKGKELQQALAERARRLAEEKGIPLDF